MHAKLEKTRIMIRILHDNEQRKTITHKKEKCKKSKEYGKQEAKKECTRSEERVHEIQGEECTRF